MHLVSKYFYPFFSSTYQQIDLTPITVQVNALMLFENHKREFSVTAEGRLIDVHTLSSKDKIAYKIYQYLYPEEMTKIINHVVKETLSAIHQLNQQSISNQEKNTSMFGIITALENLTLLII